MMALVIRFGHSAENVRSSSDRDRDRDETSGDDEREGQIRVGKDYQVSFSDFTAIA